MRPRRFEREIVGLSIAIDGYDWQGCTFKDCEMILARGDLSMVNCNFDGKCRLTLRDQAEAVGRIIELFAQGKPLKYTTREKE